MTNKVIIKDKFKDHFLLWSILIPMVFFVVILIAILYLETGFFHSEFISDIVAIMLLLIAVILAINLLIKFTGKRLNYRYFKSFTLVETTKSFLETKQLISNNGKKISHAVLLLHGYSGSTHEFAALVVKLKEAGIPYYAPPIIGFGLVDAGLLFQTKAEDWFRTALEGFDLLKEFSEEVSILGHSMGGTLATFVAQHRQVKQLILSAPGLFSCASDSKYKKILKTPVVSKLFAGLIPMLPKPIRHGRVSTLDVLNVEVLPKVFHYIALPIDSVIEAFRAQTMVSLREASFENLTLLYGEHDLTVNNKAVIEYTDRYNIKCTKYCFKNSAHNIFVDNDKEEVCRAIVAVLKENNPAASLV